MSQGWQRSGVLSVGGLWDLGSSGHQDLIQDGSKWQAFVGRGFTGKTGGESGAVRKVGKGEFQGDGAACRKVGRS